MADMGPGLPRDDVNLHQNADAVRFTSAYFHAASVLPRRCGVSGAALQLQRLREPVERPAVVRVAGEVGPVNCLGLLCPSGPASHPTDGALGKPVGGLGIGKAIFFRRRLAQHGDGFVGLALHQRNTSFGGEDGDSEHILQLV